MKDEILKSIEEIDLLIVRYQVTDGPRTAKQREQQEERHNTIGKLQYIRRTLHRMLDHL